MLPSLFYTQNAAAGKQWFELLEWFELLFPIIWSYLKFIISFLKLASHGQYNGWYVCSVIIKNIQALGVAKQQLASHVQFFDL